MCKKTCSRILSECFKCPDIRIKINDNGTQSYFCANHNSEIIDDGSKENVKD